MKSNLGHQYQLVKGQVSLWDNYLHQKALQVGLTSQQKEIFLLIFGERKTRQEVSALLNISANACQQCLGEIYAKFEILSRSRGKEKALYVRLTKDFQEEFSLTDSALQTMHSENQHKQNGSSEALITSQFDFDKAFQWIEEKISSQGERLKEVDRLILRGAWERVSYKKLAEESSLSLGYLQSDAGASLWKLLTQVLGAEVTKRNMRTVVEGQMQEQFYPSGIFQLPSEDLISAQLEQFLNDGSDVLSQGLQGLEELLKSHNSGVLAKLEESTGVISSRLKQFLAQDEQLLEQLTKAVYKKGFQYFNESQLELPFSEESAQKLEIAEFYLLVVLKLQPKYEIAYYTLGEVFLERKDFEKAVEYFRKAIVCKPMEPWALNYLGYIAIQQGNYEKAEYLLIQAFQSLKRGEGEIDPEVLNLLNNPDDIKYLKSAILKNLGWAVFAEGDSSRYPEAEAKLEEAIELDRDYAPPYCLLAQIKEALNKSAPKEWKKCLALASPCRGPEEAAWIKLATERMQLLEKFNEAAIST